MVDSSTPKVWTFGDGTELCHWTTFQVPASRLSTTVARRFTVPAGDWRVYSTAAQPTGPSSKASIR